MFRSFSVEDMELAHTLVVEALTILRDFYWDVMDASDYREYGGTSCVLKFAGILSLLATGDKPTGGNRTSKSCQWSALRK